MNLEGNYVALINPVYKKNSVIELTDEQRAQMMEEELIKLEELEIASLGPEVNREGMTELTVGDKVFIPGHRVLNAERKTIDEVNYLFIRRNDIIFKY